MKKHSHVSISSAAAPVAYAALTAEDLTVAAGGGAVLSCVRKPKEPVHVEREPMPTGERTGNVQAGEYNIPFTGSPHRVLRGLEDLGFTADSLTTKSTQTNWYDANGRPPSW